MSPRIVDPEVNASAQVAQVLEAMPQLFAHGGHKRVFQGRGVAAHDRILRDRDDGPDIQARWLQAGEGGSFPFLLNVGKDESDIPGIERSLRGAHNRPIERVTVWWHHEYSCLD